MSLLTKPKVVIDTNVFISGAVFGGNPGRILKLIEDDKIQVVVSPPIELEILIKMAKFSVSKEVVSSLKALLEQRAILVVPVKKVTVCRDPKDNMFLEASLESGADILITGDKDLLEMKEFKGTKILTPAEFLQKSK